MRARPASSIARLRAAVPALGWCCAGALVGLHGWMLHRYAVDFPLHDDYTQLANVPGAFDDTPGWRDKLAYIFSFSTDHRIATFRIAAIVQAKLLGGLNFRALIAFGNALAVAAVAVVASRAQRPLRAWAAALVAALVLSPASFVSQYWATGALAHYSVVAYAFGALFCVLRKGAGWSVAAALLAAASAFTVANGLMVLPVATVALAALGRRREALPWLVATIAIFAWYFVGHAEAGGEQGAAALLRDPLRLATLTLAVLGSAAGTFAPAVALGALIVVAWAAIALARARTDLPGELLAWIAFVALSAFAIAAGRAALGDAAVLNSRYEHYSGLACAITLLAISTRLPPEWSAAPVALGAPLALAWFARAWYLHVPNIVDVSLRLRNALAHDALVGGALWNEFPGERFGEFALRRARAAGGFAPKPPSKVAAPLVETDAPPPPPSSIYNFWASAPYVDARSITVGGIAPPAGQRVTLWLASDVRRYTAELPVERVYWTFSRASDLTMFWGATKLDGVAPGRYRVGYAFTRGDAVRAAWTDEWATVGGGTAR